MGTPETEQLVDGELADRADDVLQRIEEALGALDGIAEIPLADATRCLDALHSELQTALADLDRA